MFKKCKVVMLATKTKDNTFVGILKGIQQYFPGNGKPQPLFNTLSTCGIPDPRYCGYTKSMWEPQHLYIISDEEIKEGDYFLSNLNEILKCTKREDKFVWYEKLTVPGVSKVAQPFSIHINLKPKKIIAATDQELRIKSSIRNSNELDMNYGKLEFILPQPSESFIEKYVTEYNKGNIITHVMVEYDWYGHPDDYNNPHGIKLKINPKDNTITIRKLKDSWNREEVISLLDKYLIDITNKDIKSHSKWLEENL